MKTNVCKWGGSSLCNGQNVLKIISYIKQNNVAVAVVSAPGKRYKSDTKITDLLIKITKEPENINLYLKDIKIRYLDIINTLQVSFPLDKYLDKIKTYYLDTLDNSYLLSRGEWLIGKIIAKHLNYHFADCKKIIKFNKKGRLLPVSYINIKDVVTKHQKVIFPGFYGGYKNSVKIFSRGGSDITGAIIAKALGVNYTNFTDIDGIYNRYPLTKSSTKIKALSYSDFKFLGMFGFGVLHHKCSDILDKTSIKTTVKSTFEPKNKGTTVTNIITQTNARSKFSCLVAYCEAKKEALLKANNIYINLSFKFLDNYFYVISSTFKETLDKLNINYRPAETTAIITKKPPNSALWLGGNKYIKFNFL